MQPHAAAPPRYVWRIDLYNRLLHALMMVTFLGLAATGLPLKFNWAPWAAALAHAMGGFGAILFFHKVCAVLMSLCFLLHLARVIQFAFLRHAGGMFWGPTSMVPQPKDLADIVRHFLWFFGLGRPPRFDRFAYWEKFDYWAVFWGMAIIGTSGYVLWFSAFFARFLPGLAFNIALIIHSEEALLAVWFIFAIHFFNSHLRPDKFPMDLVIFTGRVSEAELRHERPLEYERLAGSGGLQALAADAPAPWLDNFGALVGFAVIALGFVLFGLTLWAYA